MINCGAIALAFRTDAPTKLSWHPE